MSSKRHLRRRQCQNKEALTRAQAHDRAFALSKGKFIRWHAYHCPHGNHWHVGRPSRRMRQAAAAKFRERERSR